MVFLQVSGMPMASCFHDFANKPFAGFHLVEIFDDILGNIVMKGKLHLCAALLQEENPTP